MSPAAGALGKAAAVLLLACALTACSGEAARFEGAMALFDQGRMKEAVEALSRYLDRYPEGAHAAEALFQRGTIELLYLEDLRAAVGDFREVARSFPRSPRAFDARLRIGELAETRLEDLGRARAEYQKLLADFPDHTGIGEVRFRLGEVSFRELRFDEARGHFSQLAGGTGEVAEKASFRVAVAWATEGKSAEAEAAWRDFLARFPASQRALEARVALADALEQQGRGEEAIVLLQEAAGGGGDPAPLEARIARIRERIGRRGR